MCAEKPGAKRGFRLLYFLPYICSMAKRIRPGTTFDISVMICIIVPLYMLDCMPLPLGGLFVKVALGSIALIMIEAACSIRFYKQPYTPMEPEDHLIISTV
jgi:hypothetical protein